MADSPTLDADGPIGITIKTDGAAIPDTAQVASVRIRREANRIPEAQVILETGSIPGQDFGDVDGTTYAIGKDITVAAHYGSGDPATLFSGVIVAQRLRIAEPHGPRLELLCRDKAIALTRGRKSALYAQMKDRDIIARIVSDAGLTADAAATPDSARDQLRHDTTDWDFLRALADRNGHLVLVDAGKITTGPPDTSAAAVLTLTLGEDIIEFDAAANTEGLYATARGLGWDDTAKETVEGQGGALPALTWGNQTATGLAEVPAKREHLFTTPNRLDAAEIKTMADSRLTRASLSALQGHCSFQGSGRVAPGDMVELKGLGAHFGGTAYVSGVTQVIEHGDWTTRAHLGLPEDWLTDAPGPGGGFAAGITAPIHGLHIATVLQIHEDPDARLRIKVELPLIGDQPAQVWARIAQPYASGGAGIQFMPEIGDEVVIAFLNSDPNGPVMIGALHNGQTDQPHTPDAENTLKSIVTREQLKIQFDDDKKIITIETPGGHSVTLDDDATTVTIKDSTGNTVELSESGIKMDSPKDITITAAGNIDITASGDATLSGMNVTANADMQMTAKGGAAAEFSAGGQTTVKGAMVMIN